MFVLIAVRVSLIFRCFVSIGVRTSVCGFTVASVAVRFTSSLRIYVITSGEGLVLVSGGKSGLMG